MAMNVKERLDAIKARKGIESDAELARLLGVSKQRLYGWKSRDIIDAPIIVSVFPELRPEWVERGEGDMCDQHAELLQRVERLQELIEEKDDIISKQADHIKRLTKALMGGW